MKYLEKSFKIPSNGLFDGPKEVVLREMTTREEKILLGTNDLGVFERLVKSCCVEDEVDFGSLSTIDIMYLIFMLREMTFGAEYQQEQICPHCGAKQEIAVNIGEMHVKMLSDDEVAKYHDGVTIEMSNKDKLTVKILSMGQANEVDRIIKNKVKQAKLKDPDGFAMVLRLAASISNIEPAENTEIDYNTEENKIQYVNGLRLRDLNALRNALSDVDYGLNRNIYRTCENCGEDMEVIGYIVPEFFHPSK